MREKGKGKECDTTMHFLHVLPMLVMLLNLASGINYKMQKRTDF